MNLMVENAIRQSKTLPSFDGSSSHEVCLTLHGTIQDPAFVRFLKRIDQEQLQLFSTYDFLTLDTLRRDKKLTDIQCARLPILVDAGVIEMQGRGRGVRYMLSRALYTAIGNKGTYTRKRGLDHETNKELLVKHIRDNDNDGSPLSDLKQVLPALPTSQIQTLLQQLRDEGRIQLKGQKRWARWRSPNPKTLEIDTTS